MATVTVKGNSPIDEDIRTRSIETINKLPTDILQKLAQLAQSEKAQEQLKNNFGMIKSFIL